MIRLFMYMTKAQGVIARIVTVFDDDNDRGNCFACRQMVTSPSKRPRRGGGTPNIPGKISRGDQQIVGAEHSEEAGVTVVAVGVDDCMRVAEKKTIGWRISLTAHHDPES